MAQTPTAPPPDAGDRAIAVALRYDPDGPGAPTVTASGRGMVADQILQLAFDNGVRVWEDADLAQVLAAVEVDSEIPLEAFAAIAEILAYMYRANGAAAPSQPRETDP